MSDDVARLNRALEGRYRIERELGEGGMATVYLADDLKHDRKVALKVLKPELAAVVGAERFLAEIKTTANLQHPHILPLFDSGEADGLLFYVMPFVEGETLRERLGREHQLPVDEAVKIATDLAEALDYAHRHKVIHRDIKPANILLHEGRPMIADFGIALALGAAGGGRLTETGLSLGTPYYMSPEQATGDQFVGSSTDTYALGSVLYEMLVGEPPYPGTTAQAVLGKIIAGKTVSATEHRSSIPANVDAAVRKALEKLPADRFTSAQELARALADPGFHHGTLAASGAVGRTGPWNRLSIAASALAVISTGLLVVALLPPGSGASASPVVRFTVPVGEGAEVYLGGQRDANWGWPAATSLAISPDGSLLAYTGWAAEAGDGGDENFVSRLYLRRLDRERADPVEGTEDASNPFFSPDGDWLGFFSGPSLRRVSVASMDVETIVSEAAPGGVVAGATWGDDGTIVYATADGLTRVPENGGEPELVAEVDTLEARYAFYAQPHRVSGRDVLLFHGMAGNLDPELAEIFAMDLATGNRTALLSDAMDPRYVETGRLLFVRQGTLMAVAFDPDRMAVEGQPVIVLEGVMQAVGMPNSGWESGASQLAVSRSGHMAYASGGVYPPRTTTLMRVAPGGDAEPFALDLEGVLGVRVSPEGDRMALAAGARRAVNLYIHDLVRSVTEELNTGGFADWPMEWSPDGASIAFSSDRDGGLSLYRIAADGSGEPERLGSSDRGQTMMSWSSDGVIAYLEGGDIWVLPPDGAPAPFFTSETAERYPTFSPDGRWLAYVSNQTGEAEVYVRAYPGPGAATRVSTDGGLSPAWSRDGQWIYFMANPRPGRRSMMVVDVAPGDPFRAGAPEPLIDPWLYGGTTPARNYDVLADGSFVVALDEDAFPAGDGDSAEAIPLRQRNGVGEFHVVLNFLEELRERAGN